MAEKENKGIYSDIYIYIHICSMLILFGIQGFIVLFISILNVKNTPRYLINNSSSLQKNTYLRKAKLNRVKDLKNLKELYNSLLFKSINIFYVYH